MKLVEIMVLATCCCFCACSLESGIYKNKKGFQEGKSLGNIAEGVRKLASISNSSGFVSGSHIQEAEIVDALRLGDYNKDYLSMDDWVSLLANYDRHFGRDKFFHDAARLAYSLSDGEYAGRFEKKFPELVDIYGL